MYNFYTIFLKLVYVYGIGETPTVRILKLAAVVVVLNYCYENKSVSVFFTVMATNRVVTDD